MSSFTIFGGRALRGDAVCQGSKNSSLPILAASILSGGEIILENIPRLSDVDATLKILNYLGCKTKRENGAVVIDPSGISASDIPENLMREMRSSVIFLGAVLARTGRVELFSPGGCEIGLRPIDLHLEAIKKLGAEIIDAEGKIVCTAPEGLTGAVISLSFPSVGATENVMIASCLAHGRTEIRNAAREPEISDLADFLNAMGAKVSGAGESTVVIEGVKRLHSATHSVIPDRIAGATLLAAGAITGGVVRVNGLIPAHLAPVIDIFEQAGNEIEIKSDSVLLRAPKRLKSVKTVRTMPYPGFPTDIQPPIAAMLCKAEGTSVMIETIFESRYKYIGELIRFGAKVRVDGRMAVIDGAEKLYPANAVTPDLRGGAALVLAALSAAGESTITEIKHIDRGYENLERTLSAFSAEIKRTD
ncbi:MAG: UDP-N-acetylglucosamine 1-carboxyvinyltransferase [Oscillospiraceae bacterium]|nr:UDP-N-acetylglucosamine 1-carboxyvinyltransferase [Oscillospiraceae bacterium]